MNKKFLKANVSTFAMLVVLGVSSQTTAWGEDITYTGSQAEYDGLPTYTDSDGEQVKAVYPLSSASQNNVSVSNPDDYAPGIVMGGEGTAANADSNTVQIKDARVTKYVKGGHSTGEFNASSNTVEVLYGTVILGDVLGGQAEGTGNANGNGVKIGDESGGGGKSINSPGKIIGGYSSGGEAADNTVTIYKGVRLSGNITGGVGKTVVSNNTVNIIAGILSGDIQGGYSEAGEVKNNTVTIGNISNTINVWGGSSVSGSVHDNSVVLNGSWIHGTTGGGTSNGSASVSNNQLVLKGATVEKDAVGGDVDGGADAIGNKVTLSEASKVKGDVYGGRVKSGFGNAKNNEVHVSNTSDLPRNVAQNIWGGYTDQGIAEANHVFIDQGDVDNLVVGGYSAKNAAINNTVTMSSGYITKDLYGGRSELNGGNLSNIAVSGNQVTLTGGSVNGNLVGGYADFSADATNNVVTINGRRYISDDEGAAGVRNDVYGGKTKSGKALSNIVNLKEGTVSKDVIGGSSSENIASYNQTNITGGSVMRDAYGGQGVTTDHNTVLSSSAFIMGRVYGGWSSNGDAQFNDVVIKDGTVSGEIYSGYSNVQGNVENNSLAISDIATIKANAFAGYTKSGDATGNTLTFSSAITRSSGGAKIQFISGFTENGTACKNTTSIKDVPIGDEIFQFQSDAIGGKSLNGDAVENSVFIENALVQGNVYGGITANGNATNNSVSLTGEKVEVQGTIYGGYLDSPMRGADDVFTGNTLNLVHFRGNIGNIANVQNYNWLLPRNIVNNDVLIHVTGGQAVDLTNTQHTISMESDGNRLNVGDKIVLIDNTINGKTYNSIAVHQGGLLIYDMMLASTSDGKYILTTLKSDENEGEGGNTGGGNGDEGDTGGGNEDSGHTGGGNGDGGNTGGGNGDGGHTDEGNGDSGHNSGGSGDPAGYLNPQSKAYSEGRVASLGFLRQGSDLIANSGIRAARTSVAENSNNMLQMNLVPFFVMDGSSNRYKTGSHADVDGFNIAAGLATGFELADKHLVTIGAFFEYGRGTYNTFNSFTNFASVRGDGDTNYTGGGILGRIDFAGTGLGLVNKLEADQADGLYVEASFRAGHIDTDFNTDDLLGKIGKGSTYDSGADYYGLHGGFGYVMNFDERNSVDVYGRYLWTRIDSETVNIGQDRLHFDETNSSRLRIGTRYTMAYNRQFKPYVGAAYDHEFEGDVAARAYGFKLDKPSLEGDTGIFEAGVSMTPVDTIDALSVDISAQGFIGKREGGGGGLKIKYQF